MGILNAEEKSEGSPAVFLQVDPAPAASAVPLRNKELCPA